MFRFLFATCVLLFLNSCSQKKGDSLFDLLGESPLINGKEAYLNSPFVTAGDRLYMVGHQDGSFPEIGWHVKGEMGGIWNHPIKLMDGFDVSLTIQGNTTELEKADSFINYPFANLHRYDLQNEALLVERIQFVPDSTEGLMVQFKITNQAENEKKIVLSINGHADLRPVWLGERTGMVDHQDRGIFENNMWLVKDSKNPWFVVFGSDQEAAEHKTVENEYLGKGFSGNSSYVLTLAPKSSQTFDFYIAGSYISEEEAKTNFKYLGDKGNLLFNQKKERYKQLAKLSKLSIPDPELQQTFEWLKYNCDWLIRNVPEIGTGITAGIPDYPWWFGVDSEYALKGYMAVGQTDAVYKTISLLDSVSNAVNGNGKIIHEMSTNGAVFNEGNINETPQFASLIWEIYRWNGDKEFLKKYFPEIKKGMSWLLNENDANGNLFPDGFGMMEIHGLDSEMIDVAAYTQRAFEDASKIAEVLKDNDLVKQYAEIAEELKKRINLEFWSDEFNSYADFIGTDEQALHLIDDAIVRADTLNKPWAVAELEQTKKAILNNPSPEPRPFVLHHNWVVNTPMEMKIAEKEKAEKALRTAENFVNPFGVFVTGIDRDASAGSDDGSFQGSKIFSYTGAVMTLPTGVQAIAENNYGNPDKALNYLKRMTRTFSYALPGSMYEVSPDYGMIIQAWNIYSFAVPIVQQFFGIQPDASGKKVVIEPQMPSEWGFADLENVQIADNSVSVYYQSKMNKTSFRVQMRHPGWTVKLRLPHLENAEYKIVSGDAEKQISGDFVLFTSFQSELEVMIVRN